MPDQPITIPVTLDPQFDSFFTGLQQFTRRVHREFSGFGRANTPMESLFFSKTGTFSKTMSKEIDEIPRKMGKAIKKVVADYKQASRALKSGDTTALSLFPGFGEKMARGTSWAGRGMRGLGQTVAGSAFGRMAGRVGGAVGAGGRAVGRGVEGAARVVLAPLKKVGREFQSFGRILKQNTKTLQRWGRGFGRMLRAAGRMGGRGFGALGRGAMRVGRGVGKAGGMMAMGAAAGGIGLLAGMIGGHYMEGIQAYEASQAARLQAAATLGPGARMVGGARAGRLGYKIPEAVGLQAQAAQLGMGGTPQAAQGAMMLMRTLGQPGLMAGAGMMRRRGLAGAGGLRTMFRDLSKVMEASMAAGIERARLPELLGLANDYAEQQIAITPDKGAQKKFALTVARMSEVVPEMFKGRYGAQTLNTMDRAIKSASGPFQSFVLRAAGFGKGASYLGALRQQEEGALAQGPRGELLIGRVIKQAIAEGGGGQYGGLSGSALVSLSKHFGISTKAMENVSKVFATEKGESARKKIEGIVMKAKEKAKLEGKSTLEKDAFKSMIAFGNTTRLIANRFNKMAQQGGTFYAIKEEINKMKMAIGRLLTPLLRLVAKYMPVITKYVIALVEGIKAFMANLTSIFKIGKAGKAASRAFHLSLGEQERQLQIEKLKERLRADPKFRAGFLGRVARSKREHMAKHYEWMGGKMQYYGYQDVQKMLRELRSEGVVVRTKVVVKKNARGQANDVSAQTRATTQRGKGSKGKTVSAAQVGQAIAGGAVNK